MNRVVTYVYTRVKMKNITILLSICWVIWFSQILAISTLLNRYRKINQEITFQTTFDGQICNSLAIFTETSWKAVPSNHQFKSDSTKHHIGMIYFGEIHDFHPHSYHIVSVVVQLT